MGMGCEVIRRAANSFMGGGPAWGLMHPVHILAGWIAALIDNH